MLISIPTSAPIDDTVIRSVLLSRSTMPSRMVKVAVFFQFTSLIRPNVIVSNLIHAIHFASEILARFVILNPAASKTGFYFSVN